MFPHGSTYSESNTLKSIKGLGLPYGLCDLSPPLLFWNDAAETQWFYINNGLKRPTGYQYGNLYKGSSSPMTSWTYCPASFYSECTTKLTKFVKPLSDMDLVSHILRMVVPRHWWTAGATEPQSVRKLIEALEVIKKPSWLKRDLKGLKRVWREEVLPRKRWSLSAIESQRSASWMWSTASSASSMGTCTTPITPQSVVNMRRMGLQMSLQGKAHSTIHAVRMRCASIIIPMRSCSQKMQNLKNLKRNSSALTKSIRAIVTVTAKTPTHPEVMDQVALKNW